MRYDIHFILKLANDRFKCDSACVSWLQLSIYFNFCCFRALAYTTLDKLSAVFFLFLIFAVLLIWRMTNCVIFSCLSYVISKTCLFSSTKECLIAGVYCCLGNTATVSELYHEFIKLSFPIRDNEKYAFR